MSNMKKVVLSKSAVTRLKMKTAYEINEKERRFNLGKMLRTGRITREEYDKKIDGKKK